VWTNLGTATTATDGSYRFTISEALQGTYRYQVNSQSDTLYATSYAGCSVVVGTLSPTVLSMNTSNATPAVNQSFTLSGYLTVTSKGTPVSGKQITLVKTGPDGQSTTVTATTTDTNGAYTVTRSESSQGTYTYTASLSTDTTYNASSASLSVLVGTLRPTVLSVTTSNVNPTVNQSFTLSGYLKDNATGAPLSGKQIFLLRNAGGVWTNLGTATTATDGSYRFTISEALQGTYRYQVNSQSDTLYATSYAGCSVLIGTFHTSQLSIFTTSSTASVGQPFTLHGFLTDINGTPLSNEQITLFRQDPSGQQTAVNTTTTAANGSYTFTRSESSQGAYWYWGVFSGDQNYTQTHTWNGWVPVAIGNVQNATNTVSTTNATPAVNETFTIYGYLQDTNGIGIPNKQILLYSEAPTGAWTRRASYVTNATGFYTFTLSEQSAGEYWYEAQFLGDENYTAAFGGLHEHVGSLTPTSISLNTSNSNPTPNQTFTLSGYLTDVNGTPISGVQIDLYRRDSSGQTVQPASRVTDTNGYYSFVWSEPEQGTFAYTVASNGYQNFAISVASLTMTIGTLRPTVLSVTTSNVNPTVNQSFTLSGYLKDNATGAPLSGKQIFLLRNAGGVWTNLGTATTATDGSYRFTISEALQGTYRYQVNSQSDTLYATSYAGCSVVVGAA
jgi:5-hydroxyisourate hydrolase-like protein (transthyretin family)